MNDDDAAASVSSFIDRLSRWLAVITGILAFVSVRSLIADFGSFSAADVAGVGSNEDIEILDRLNWTTTIFGVGLWAFLLYAMWSLWKRRNWARRVVVGVLGFVGFCGLWWGALLLAAALGLTSIGGPPDASDAFRAALHGFFGTISLAALVLAYVCWRLIKRLRSAVVVKHFRAQET